MIDRYREGDLVRAMFSLTDTPEEYERLYLTSSSFKHGVDFFVRAVVPTYLRGLGVDAIHRDNEHAARIREVSARTTLDVDFENLDLRANDKE